MRAIVPDILNHLGKLLEEGVFVWAIAIEATPGKAFYLTNHNKDLWYAGRVWQSFPIKLESHKASGDGDLTSTTLTMSNIGRLAMPYLESGLWDQGEVVLIPVYANDPDGLPINFQPRYAIQGASATHEVITLNLAQPNFLNRQFPNRKYLRAEGFPSIPQNRA